MVVAPRYMNGSKSDKLYEGAFDTLTKVKVGCFAGSHEVGYFHQIKGGAGHGVPSLWVHTAPLHHCRRLRRRWYITSKQLG